VEPELAEALAAALGSFFPEVAADATLDSDFSAEALFLYCSLR
jgi:hypothetical protein